MPRVITQKSGKGPKYKQMYQRMKDENPQLFKDFKKVHDKFLEDNIKNRVEFNKVGEEFAEQVRIYTDHLCRTSESSGYQSSKLADQFRGLIISEFSELDEIGIT
ncbi:MAG: hypothetical protein ACMG57_04365 [Candidatus Dojkabacteria bacterium]